MYKNLRNYIWGFKTVETLADLEIEIYTTFPNLDKLKNSFNALYIDIKPVLADAEDENLNESVDKFRTLLFSLDDTFYSKINQVREVI